MGDVKKIKFDFYYGNEAEQFNFYRTKNCKKTS